MQALIAFFAPSLLGVKLIDYLVTEDKKEGIFDYIILLIFSSMINNVISYSLFHIESNVFYYLNQLPIYFVKYLFVSIIVNVLISVVIAIIKKNISLKLEVGNKIVQKKKKKSKNK